MSHRLFDELGRLRQRLAALEVEIVLLRKGSIVDFAELSELRKTREILLGQIAAKEAAAAH